MNERLIYIRKTLDLTQEQFGNRLGVTRAAISRLESGGRNITEQMIMSICREFNVREEWLRYGIEPQFNDPDTFSLDEYAKQKGLSELEFEIIKGYMELDKDLRKGLMAHLKSIFNKPTAESEKQDEEKDLSPPRVAEEVKEYSSKEPSVEELEEEYKKNVLGNVPKRDVYVSSGIEGDINKAI